MEDFKIGVDVTNESSTSAVYLLSGHDKDHILGTIQILETGSVLINILDEVFIPMDRVIESGVDIMPYETKMDQEGRKCLASGRISGLLESSIKIMGGFRVVRSF